MPTSLTQDVYPYAEGGPVTYMAPGQRFYTSEPTPAVGTARPRLLTTLQQLGVPPRTVLIANMPTTPPAPPAPSTPRERHARAVVADRCEPGGRGSRGQSFVFLRKRQTIVPSTG